MNERMSGNAPSLTNPSGEVHSNNQTTPLPNYLNTAYALMFYNDRSVRELMSPKYEKLIRNAFNLYLQHLPQSGGVPMYEEMTFTNYVLNSLAEAGFFMPHERATVDEIEDWRVMNRLFIGESYTMRPLLAEFSPNSALQQEAAFALQSAVVLRSVLPPQPRFGSQQLQFPVHPGHMISPSFPNLPQSATQLPPPPAPSPLQPLLHSTPSRPVRSRTDWSIENLLSLNQTIKDESPAAESRPEIPASPFTHRSVDSPSDCLIESAPEHFEPVPSGSFQQLTDRSYEPFPATSANSTRARSYEPSTSRSFQPTAASSSERADENSVGGSKNSRRTGVGTLDPPPKRSSEPPVTRSNQSSARSTERSPSLSLASATAPKDQTYPAPYFRPSIGSGDSQASSSGFVPPTAAGVHHDTSSGYQQSATQRPTLRFVDLPAWCFEPPPAHTPIKWPIPDHLPMPPLVTTIKPLSTPLPSPTLSPISSPLPMPPPTPSPIPPPLAMSPPLPMTPPLPMPPPSPMPPPLAMLPPLPMPPSLPMPVHSQVHMPILRANQVQMAVPPPEYQRLSRPKHIPLPPRRSHRETTGCPLCRTNTHK